MILQDSAFHVLYTKKIIETKNFYENLGATIVEFEKEKLVVNLAGFDLHFILASSEPFSEYHYVADSNSYGDGVLFYFAVSNIQEFYKQIESSNSIIKSVIKKNHWQAQEFLFEDPNGYKLVAYQ